MRPGDFYLAGWRVRSELCLTGLLPWIEEDRPVDLLICRGPVPKYPDCLAMRGPLLGVTSDRSTWFTAPTARFFVSSEGTEVTVETGNRDDQAVQPFLLGSIFAILCYKRGLLPLHASCVEIGGRAVAFAGASGAGKSVFAAAFMKAGFSVISDDISAIDTGAPGGPTVRASSPELRLWRDALEALHLTKDRHQQTRAVLEKFDLACGQLSTIPPRRLAAVYCLRRANKGDSGSIKRISGVGALRHTADSVYHSEALGTHLGATAGFRQVTTLCSAVPVYSLSYQPGFDELPATVATFLARHTEQL